jgi:acetyl esterase/lipase
VTRLAIGILIAFVVPGCVYHVPGGQPRPVQSTRDVILNGSRVTLHLSSVGVADRRLLVVYATGDGGWRGKDLDLFRHLVSWGYATAGFSAPQYVKQLQGADEITTPARLARDYAAIIAAAEQALALPDSTAVILVGVSRGAGLSVVAAGQPAIRPLIDGVVVMGLTKEEEHVRWRRRRRSTELQIYDYLPQLADLPIAVIQSTRDNYLPAADARSLFGADTARRQFHAIDARNHSFAGARPVLYDTLRASLEWVTSAAGHADAEGAP